MWFYLEFPVNAGVIVAIAMRVVKDYAHCNP